MNFRHMHQSIIWQLKQPDFILDLAKCLKNRTNSITFWEEFQNIKGHHFITNTYAQMDLRIKMQWEVLSLKTAKNPQRDCQGLYQFTLLS